MRLIFLLLLLLSSLQGFSQVVINEFLSSNATGYKDEDGERCDWIELYNPSAQSVDLTGYYLSDDSAFRKRWCFPALSLKSGSFLLICASGKNRTDIPLSHQTIIDRGDFWKYFVPSSETGNSWTSLIFNDSSWQSGKSGFGFGDNDDSTILNNIKSVFVRKQFVISNLQDITELVLSIDYDDGFAAYINGHEIARSNLGTAGSAIAYNQSASASREATMYKGGLPQTFTVTNPSDILVEGVNVIAVQGHNNSSTSTDLSLIPMLSLGLRGAGYIDQMPSYIQLKGIRLHTNFKIDNEGEPLIISRPDTIVADSVPPKFLDVDISCGRQPDGSQNWLYFRKPTPGSANITEGDIVPPASDTVKFSIAGGYFQGSISVQLYTSNPSDSIYYTLNGAEPSSADSLYRHPVAISSNRVIRARIINTGGYPGFISTNTYFVTRHYLPVVCLSTNPENLWDYLTGIYVMGPNASTTSPYFGANFWQDWERKAHMEFYDIQGNKKINQQIGIKIYGNYSRARPQKSMSLHARSEYGKGSFGYKFFSDKPIEEFEAVVLRNGGNDWGGAIMRDGLTSTLIRNMDIDRQAFQPAILYLNGEYWGILNLREKINPNYLAENHFVNPDEVNLLEKNAAVIDGSNTSYVQLNTYLNSNTLETVDRYSQVAGKIDIDNFIQYQMTQIYINNQDWPGNNIKFWNTNEPGSLWRWIIFDTDFGFGYRSTNDYTQNTLEFALAANGPGWPNPPWSTLLFRRLVTNAGFRNNFVLQYADRINTNFSAARITEVVDSLRAVYLPEINYHLNRWGLSLTNWENSITRIRNYASSRPDYARAHLKQIFGLGDLLTIRVDVAGPNMGKVKVNSVVPRSYPFYGIYFRNLPIKLTAIPSPGYKFLRWEYDTRISGSETLDYQMEKSCFMTAVFTAANENDVKIVINEINYNSSQDKDTEDWIELYNCGKATVNLRNWIISDGGPASGLKINSDIVIAPGNYVVICRDTEAFKTWFPWIRNITGNMNFGLSSSGDDIYLYDPSGEIIDEVSFLPYSPWPANANGTGATIELINALSDNNLGKNWRATPDGGSPGTENIVTGVNDRYADIASAFELSCFPNPFRDFTTIRTGIRLPGKYRLEVLDLQGRPFTVLEDKFFEPGEYYFDLGGKGFKNGLPGAGVYIIRMKGLNHTGNLKVICIQ